MLMPSTSIPYDACAASEGTQEIPMHDIPSPHHSPESGPDCPLPGGGRGAAKSAQVVQVQ
jgi:hypothetical protein